MARDLATRFWSKVDKNGPIPEHKPELGPCWQWTASTRKGYGIFWLISRMVQAHRVAYELTVGVIPGGLEPDHLCSNRRCVKAIADENGPAHLEIVTHQENMIRAPNRMREKTHCDKGHPFDETNTYWRPTGGRACRACKSEYQTIINARRGKS